MKKDHYVEKKIRKYKSSIGDDVCSTFGESFDRKISYEKKGVHLRIWCQVFYKTWQSSHTSSPFYKGRGHTWQHDPPRHLQSD